jgi:hypothetical protein
VSTGEGVSTLDRLEELDRLLRDVQAELMPEAEIPDPPPPHPIPEPALDHSPQLELLSTLAAGLLASMRALLAGYERVLTPPAPATRPARLSPEPPHATISAGPFPSPEALRSFGNAVSTLPGVSDVAVRADDGTDRAIIDVRLDQPTP